MGKEESGLGNFTDKNESEKSQENIIDVVPIKSEVVENSNKEETISNSDEFPVGYPMRDTLKMLGVKPEKEVPAKESGDYPMDYPMRDTLKSMGIKYGEGIDNPDTNKLEESLLSKAGEKINNIKEKTSSFFGKAWSKVTKFGSKTKEAGMSALNDIGEAYTEVKKDVVYVKDSIKEKYDGVMNYGKEKVDSIKQRAEDVKEVFKVALEEAKRRKDERIKNTQEKENMKEYLKRKEEYKQAKARLVEIKKKMGMIDENGAKVAA